MKAIGHDRLDKVALDAGRDAETRAAKYRDAALQGLLKNKS